LISKEEIRSLQSGDKILISKTAEIESGGEDFVDDMRQFQGEVLTVRFADDYCVYVQENRWYWTKEMIEGIIPANYEEVGCGFDLFDFEDGV